jgi:hypothetical protein
MDFVERVAGRERGEKLPAAARAAEANFPDRNFNARARVRTLFLHEISRLASPRFPA